MAEFDKSVVGGRVREDVSIDAGLRNHMNSVFGFMATGMLISALVSYGMSLSPSLVYTLRTGGIGFIVAFVPLILIFSFGAAAQRLSANGALIFFYAIAAMIGVFFSSLFLLFTGESLLTAFLTTSAAFGGLALYGYTTKRNLSALGRFLTMALVGILVAMLINWFMHSNAIHFATSVIGLIVFAGFTAYDTQNIKNHYLQTRHLMGAEEMKKVAIFGALYLYLDFINLFQFLLSFLGSRE